MSPRGGPYPSPSGTGHHFTSGQKKQSTRTGHPPTVAVLQQTSRFLAWAVVSGADNDRATPAGLTPKSQAQAKRQPAERRPFPVSSDLLSTHRRGDCSAVATSPPTAMSTAISSPPEPAHPSASRAPSYQLPSRSQSTRSRPPASSAPATAPPLPHRAASHHQGSRQASSSGRPAHDIIPHEEYANETTNVAAARQHSKRSNSRDRPPSASRPESASQPQRRNSQRSTNGRSSGQPDMTTSANNPGPVPVSHGGAAAGAQKHGRSRTTIPTQSGKWILGKTIGAGSMGKVKLAKKEDSSEQVRHPNHRPRRTLGDGCARLTPVTLYSRSRARSFPVYLPMTASILEPNENEQINLRKFGLRARLRSSPCSTTHISAGCGTWSGRTTTGTCFSNTSTAARCSTTSSRTGSSKRNRRGSLADRLPALSTIAIGTA